MTARIVVLDGQALNPGDLSWAPLAELGELVVHEHTDPAEVVERARGAHVLVTNKTLVDAATLDAAAPELRGICVLATGVNVVDVAAAKARNLPVCNVPDYSTPSVVEHTFALLLALCRDVGQHDRAVHEGAWAKSKDFCFWLTPQRELWSGTFGVVGYGTIGRAVSRVAAAFGMKVIATHSRSSGPESGVTTASVDEVFRASDVVSLHCPLTPETRELIRWDRLCSMKRTALLLNTARGALINEADLARALREGVIAGAGLDVLTEEPPKHDNPLLLAPHCIVTPHLAWSTLSARQRLLAITTENVRSLLAGRPIHVVGP